MTIAIVIYTFLFLVAFSKKSTKFLDNIKLNRIFAKILLILLLISSILPFIRVKNTIYFSLVSIMNIIIVFAFCFLKKGDRVNLKEVVIFLFLFVFNFVVFNSFYLQIFVSSNIKFLIMLINTLTIFLAFKNNFNKIYVMLLANLVTLIFLLVKGLDINILLSDIAVICVNEIGIVVFLFAFFVKKEEKRHYKSLNISTFKAK